MPDAPELSPQELEERALVARGGRELQPWMREFGRWLSEHRGPPRVQKQLDELKHLTGTDWSYQQLKALQRDNELFRDYCSIMRERGLRAAKERLGEVAYDAVEGLAEGIKFTRAEKDYSTMAKLTGQVLERTMPRRDDLNTQRLAININLSEKQQALLGAAPVDVEFEVLE